jgi:hypothetical protein
VREQRGAERPIGHTRAQHQRHWKSSGIATKRGELSDRDFQMWVDWLILDGQLKKGQLEIRDLYTNQFQSDPRELASSAP